MKLSQATKLYITLMNKYKGFIDTWDAIYKLDTEEIDSTTVLYEEIKNNLIDTGYFTAKEMIDMIGKICNESLHYRRGYIELMKRIIEGYQCTDIYNISFLSQYDDIKINTPEYAIMNDNEDELLYHLKSKRLDLTKILEKCCLRGAVNCFKLLQKEFDVKITKRCLDASFKGNNQHIINECLKENEPDIYTTEAAIVSHNFANLYILLNEYGTKIQMIDCGIYKNLHAFIYLLDLYEIISNAFVISPYFHIPSLCEYMIQNGADINYTDEDGINGLFSAVVENQTDIVSNLILNRVNITALDSEAFESLIQKNNILMLEFLLSHGANVNTRNREQGHSILHVACVENNIEAVNILISHGANINDNRNIVQQTPLIFACSLNHKEIAELLISRGANVTMQDYEGHSVLHIAIASNIEQRDGTFEANLEINRNTKDLIYPLMSGATPLDLAILREKTDFKKYLGLKDYHDPSKEAKKIQTLLKLHGGKTNLK